MSLDRIFFLGGLKDISDVVERAIERDESL